MRNTVGIFPWLVVSLQLLSNIEYLGISQDNYCIMFVTAALFGVEGLNKETAGSHSVPHGRENRQS